MEINIIGAATDSGVIGKDNQLLWKLPNEMKFFKNTTMGCPIIVGRKTFESFGRVLPGRKNIVVTRNPNWSFEGAVRACDLIDAIQIAQEDKPEKVFIIGGGEIYKKALLYNLGDIIYLTRVHAELEGDTFFPDIDPRKYKMESEEKFYKDEKHAYDYTIYKLVHIFENKL